MVKLTKTINGRKRFVVGKLKGFVALRKFKSRGWGVERQRTFTQVHLGRLSLAFDTRPRHTYNFAG